MEETQIAVDISIPKEKFAPTVAHFALDSDEVLKLRLGSGSGHAIYISRLNLATLRDVLIKACLEYPVDSGAETDLAEQPSDHGVRPS